jgi:hypothetical protein
MAGKCETNHARYAPLSIDNIETVVVSSVSKFIAFSQTPLPCHEKYVPNH